MMNWKGFLIGSVRGLISRYYPGIRLEGLRKTTRNLNQDSRSLGPRIEPGPPEYEAGVLTTHTRRSVLSSQRRGQHLGSIHTYQ
jgi:hypothetical protein